MTRPLFSVVVPTMGRDTLIRTLESIRSQPTPGAVEVVIVADTFEMPPVTVERIKYEARSYEARFIEHNAGRHDTGSPQLARGYAMARGAWILNVGDDDVYEPFAFRTIRLAIEHDVTTRPLMFRTVLHPAPHRGNALPVVLWHTPEITRGRITGQCFCVPNDPDKLGRWVDDVTFMTETVEAWGGLVGWRTDVISQCY